MSQVCCGRHTYNLSIWKAKGGGFWVSSKPGYTASTVSKKKHKTQGNKTNTPTSTHTTKASKQAKNPCSDDEQKTILLVIWGNGSERGHQEHLKSIERQARDGYLRGSRDLLSSLDYRGLILENEWTNKQTNEHTHTQMCKCTHECMGQRRVGVFWSQKCLIPSLLQE